MNQKKLIIGIFIILTFVVGVFVWQKRENQILPQDLQLFNNQVQPDTQNDIQSKSDEVPPLSISWLFLDLIVFGMKFQN